MGRSNALHGLPRAQQMVWFSNKEEESFYKRLKTERKNRMPNQASVVAAGIDEVLKGRSADESYIKSNFSDLVLEFEQQAHDFYRAAERRVLHNIINDYFLRDPDGTKREFNAIRNALFENVHALDGLFMSFSQSRKSRGGGAFEEIVQFLFKKLEYPCEAQPELDGTPDFVLPSADHYSQNPSDCIIFTAKRTLRERWKQITTEGRHGFRQFLATIDKDLSSPMLSNAKQNRIYVVVPEAVRVAHYEDEVNVISFETFLSRFLDRAVADWREDGII